MGLFSSSFSNSGRHANTNRADNIAKGLKRKGGLNTDKGKRASGVKKGARGRGTKTGRDVFGPGDLDRWG